MLSGALRAAEREKAIPAEAIPEASEESEGQHVHLYV